MFCGWTDSSVTILLTLLKEAFSNEANIPTTYYDAQKKTQDLGFTYKIWDSCPNNCMLFWNKYENLGECVICHQYRYKMIEDKPNDDLNEDWPNNVMNEVQSDKV